MEVEHIIGQSAARLTTRVIPNSGGKYLTVTGGCLIVNSVNDPHEQSFLRTSHEPVSCLQVSRSGKFIVVGIVGSNPDVILYDATTFERVQRFAEHDGGAIYGLDINTDDTLVCSFGGGDNRLCFFDVSNGGLVTHFPMGALVPTESVRSAHLSMGGRVQDVKRCDTDLCHVSLVTPGNLFLLHLNPFTGTVSHVVAPSQMRTNMSSFLRQYSVGIYSDHGDLFFLGTMSGEVGIVSTANGALLLSTRVCGHGIRDIALFSEGGAATGGYANFGPGSQRSTTLFVGGGDGSVSCLRLNDHSQPQSLATVARTTITTTPIAKNPSSDEVGARRVNRYTAYPDATDEPAPVLGVGSVSILSMGSPAQLLVSDVGGSVFAVQMVNSQPSVPERFLASSSLTRPPPAEPKPTSSLPGNVHRLSDAVVCPVDVVLPFPTDPVSFLSASRDGVVRQWSLDNYLTTGPLGADTTSVKSKALGLVCHAMRVVDTLQIVLSCWSDGAVRCHDLTNRTLLWTHAQAHRVAVTALAVSESAKFYVTGGQDGEIKVWDSRTKELKAQMMKAHGQEVIYMELFSDERHLLSAGRDRTVCTWSLGSAVNTLTRVTTHTTHTGPLTACQLSRTTQQHYFSSSVDRQIHVCDLRYNKEPVKVADYNRFPALDPTSAQYEDVTTACRSLSRGTESHATSFAVTPDERMMVTGGSDSLVKLWDMERLEPVAVGACHSSPVSSVGVACDAKQAISCGSDHAVVVWNLFHH